MVKDAAKAGNGPVFWRSALFIGGSPINGIITNKTSRLANKTPITLKEAHPMMRLLILVAFIFPFRLAHFLSVLYGMFGVNKIFPSHKYKYP
jgi:hypothetical protein